jgi:DNA-binding transcriptional ArsR family regulator
MFNKIAQEFLKICATKWFHYICNLKVSYKTMRRDVFQAIADPIRREILNIIAQETLNVNAVAGHFDVSRTAVYKHVKILTECGLVVMKQKGRERFCEAKLEKLNEVSAWVEQYRKFWDARLDNLENYLNELKIKKRTT